MKYLKSLKIASNIDLEAQTPYILLDLEVCNKNMKMNETLLTNFFGVIQRLKDYIEHPWILNDNIITQLSENIEKIEGIQNKEEEIKNNDFYKFLCDIYSGINYKIRGIYGFLTNIIYIFSGLKIDFEICATKIKNSLKDRNDLISNFTSNFKKYNQIEVNFRNFVNGLLFP